MLYKSISTINNNLNFIKYNEYYKEYLAELYKLSPQFAKAVEEYPKNFSELSDHQSYLLLQDMYSFVGAIVIGTSTDEKRLEVALFLNDETLNSDNLKLLLNEIIDSLGNYFYDKEAIEIVFANDLDQNMLQTELSLYKRQYTDTFISYYKENPFHKSIPALLSEIQYAEQFLLNLKQSWMENYSGISDNFDSQLDKELMNEYWNHSISYNGKVFYKADSILWSSIKSKKADRTIAFDRNGTITFEKKSYNSAPTYDTICNVTNQDFSITANQPFLKEYNIRRIPIYGNHSYSLIRTNNVYTISMDNIEIIYNLDKESRIYRIKQPYKKENGNASVVLEARADENNKISSGFVEIKTHKNNGKINGTCRINVSSNGINAHFYSRKGHKFDLSDNSILTSKLLRLAAYQNTESTFDKEIATSFVEDNAESISTSIQQKEVKFDVTDFNMRAIANAEVGVINFFKQIYGEIPIKCLSERLMFFFEYIKDHKLKENNGIQRKITK